jgi:hypothetical protein
MHAELEDERAKVEQGPAPVTGTYVPSVFDVRRALGHGVPEMNSCHATVQDRDDGATKSSWPIRGPLATSCSLHGFAAAACPPHLIKMRAHARKNGQAEAYRYLVERTAARVADMMEWERAAFLPYFSTATTARIPIAPLPPTPRSQQPSQPSQSTVAHPVIIVIKDSDDDEEDQEDQEDEEDEKEEEDEEDEDDADNLEDESKEEPEGEEDMAEVELAPAATMG